ncbi:MAG: hypothetical protein IPJ65_17320 [Archangiaceae bacterium]|nr:hypothetical protein [Archangiaceae bacterium]
MIRCLVGSLCIALAACSSGGNGGTGGGGGSSAGGTGGSSGGTGGSGGAGGGQACQANTMTDANNCGRCGRICESGTCSGGSCRPMLVLDVPNPPTSFQYANLVSGGKVYEWEYTTAPTTPTFFVYSAPAPATALTAASPGTVLQSSVQPSDPNLGMSAVTFDATYIYEAAPGAAAGSVSRKKLDGSEPTGDATPLFTLPKTDPGAAVTGCTGHATRPPSSYKWVGIAVEGTAAYLAGTTTANGGSFPCDDATVVYSISPFPATASTVATKVTGLDHLGYIVSDFTVAGGHLFWFDNSTDSSKRTLFTAPVTGGTPVMLEDDVFAGDHAAIVSDGTHVYWTLASAQGKVRRAPLANLTPAAATDVVDVESPCEGLAVDATHVYYMTTDSFRTVARVPKAGGTEEVVGNMVVPPSVKGSRLIGVDDTYAYATDIDGKVYRVFKTP